MKRGFQALALAAAVLLPVTALAQKPSLKNAASLNEKAPATYKARFDTSAGVFVVEVTRDLAPLGADRFYNLVKNGFYDGTRFFRVISGFMVQFGIHGDPAVSAVWRNARINDDPVKGTNSPMTITFATGGPNTRTTQVFINFGNNAGLDKQGFAPFGRVIEGQDVVKKIYAEYGEGAPRGKGPDQGRLQMEGNAYLAKDYPKMDYIKSATIEK
ncbi:MAG TPA: peptidylprolyl isomerase [Vicinamibacterales bacterium]|jgi:peptidyl-prolyl cis-trans isomerase A (cyclophilin A)